MVHPVTVSVNENFYVNTYPYVKDKGVSYHSLLVDAINYLITKKLDPYQLRDMDRPYYKLIAFKLTDDNVNTIDKLRRYMPRSSFIRRVLQRYYDDVLVKDGILTVQHEDPKKIITSSIQKRMMISTTLRDKLSAVLEKNPQFKTLSRLYTYIVTQCVKQGIDVYSNTYFDPTPKDVSITVSIPYPIYSVIREMIGEYNAEYIRRCFTYYADKGVW